MIITFTTNGAILGLNREALCDAIWIRPEDHAGHILRAGLVTSAALAGVYGWKIRRQTGHQSDAMLQR